MAAKRSYPTSEVRGSRGECQAVTAQEWPRGDTPGLRTGVVAGRSNPKSKERWLHGCRRAQRNHSNLKVRKGSGEEIALIKGKEQQLHFAGAAVKRYPTPKERETQVRW